MAKKKHRFGSGRMGMMNAAKTIVGGGLLGYGSNVVSQSNPQLQLVQAQDLIVGGAYGYATNKNKLVGAALGAAGAFAASKLTGMTAQGGYRLY